MVAVVTPIVVCSPRLAARNDDRTKNPQQQIAEPHGKLTRLEDESLLDRHIFADARVLATLLVEKRDPLFLKSFLDAERAPFKEVRKCGQSRAEVFVRSSLALQDERRLTAEDSLRVLLLTRRLVEQQLQNSPRLFQRAAQFKEAFQVAETFSGEKESKRALSPEAMVGDTAAYTALLKLCDRPNGKLFRSSNKHQVWSYINRIANEGIARDQQGGKKVLRSDHYYVLKLRLLKLFELTESLVNVNRSLSDPAKLKELGMEKTKVGTVRAFKISVPALRKLLGMKALKESASLIFRDGFAELRLDPSDLARIVDSKTTPKTMRPSCGEQATIITDLPSGSLLAPLQGMLVACPAHQEAKTHNKEICRQYRRILYEHLFKEDEIISATRLSARIDEIHARSRDPEELKKDYSRLCKDLEASLKERWRREKFADLVDGNVYSMNAYDNMNRIFSRLALAHYRHNLPKEILDQLSDTFRRVLREIRTYDRILQAASLNGTSAARLSIAVATVPISECQFLNRRLASKTERRAPVILPFKNEKDIDPLDWLSQKTEASPPILSTLPDEERLSRMLVRASKYNLEPVIEALETGKVKVSDAAFTAQALISSEDLSEGQLKAIWRAAERARALHDKKHAEILRRRSSLLDEHEPIVAERRLLEGVIRAAMLVLRKDVPFLPRTVLARKAIQAEIGAMQSDADVTLSAMYPQFMPKTLRRIGLLGDRLLPHDHLSWSYFGKVRSVSSASQGVGRDRSVKNVAQKEPTEDDRTIIIATSIFEPKAGYDQVRIVLNRDPVSASTQEIAAHYGHILTLIACGHPTLSYKQDAVDFLSSLLQSSNYKDCIRKEDKERLKNDLLACVSAERPESYVFESAPATSRANFVGSVKKIAPLIGA